MTPSQEEDYNTTKVISMPHNGCRLYRKPTQVGGFQYVTDELGGDTVVWDTSLIDCETVRMALEDEHLFHSQFPIYPILCDTITHWPIGKTKTYSYQGRTIDLETCDYADGVHMSREQWIIKVLDQVRDGLFNMHSRTGFRCKGYFIFKFLGHKITAEFLSRCSVQKLRSVSMLITSDLNHVDSNQSNRSP